MEAKTLPEWVAFASWQPKIKLMSEYPLLDLPLGWINVPEIQNDISKYLKITMSSCEEVQVQVELFMI